MKKIFIGLFFGILMNLQGQFQLAGSDEFGQILDVTYDVNLQNTVYGRTVNNHIVKSSDLGETWEVIHSVPQENYFITVKDLRLTADGTALSYLCVAEGTSFNRLEILNITTETVEKQMFSPIGAESGSLVQSYSLASNDSDIALLHTTRMINWGLTTEIFYTVNGGTDWESIYFGPDYGDINVNNVMISPYDEMRLFIMRGGSPNPTQGGLLISEDAGQNWVEKLPNTTYSALTFHPENENEIYLGTYYLSGEMEENLYKSTDGGDTWNIVPINWTAMSSNSIHSIVYNLSNLNKMVILEENEIVLSEDGGQTWENHVYPGEDFETEYYYGISASYNPFVENQLIVSANYYPFISNDGGTTIEKFRSPVINSTGRMAVFQGENNHVYYGLRGGFIHKDLQTQTENEIGLMPLGGFSNSSNSGVYSDKHKEGRLFFSTSSMMGQSAVHVSNDHGANFTTFYNGSYLLLTATRSFPSNPDIVLIAFGEMLFKFDLSDLENVTHQEFMLPTAGFVENMLFGENEDQFFIVQQNKIHKTTDNGQTWQELTHGLESLAGSDFIYDIKRNPLNSSELGIATSKGLFISNDNGQNWESTAITSPMNRIEFSAFADGKILASSRFEDGSFYPAADSKTVYTKDGGENWIEISTDELGYMRTMTTEILFTDENSADVYFQVPDLGLVQYSLDLTTMGVIDSELNASLTTIYPNPTSGILHIQSKTPIQKMMLVDITGRKLVETSNSTLNISNLPKGVYLLQIQLENGKMETKKIVKK